jgi:hypothetical protein
MLLVASVLVVLCAVASCLLNLLERRKQQRRLTTNPPSASSIRDTVNTIHTVGRISLFIGFAAIALLVIWIVQRRPKQRRTAEGETATESSLWNTVPRPLFITLCGTWIAMVALSLAASSASDPNMTIHDFISYRTWLAGAAAARVVAWTCVAIMVVLATRRQDQREAATPARPSPKPDTEISDHPGWFRRGDNWYCLRHGAISCEQCANQPASA